jgi:hypothetical protein
MPNIQNELDKLFAEWKDRYVSTDGILDEEKYWSAMPRITFLLKEMYDDTYLDNKIAPLPDLYRNGYGPEGGSPGFWRNLRTWQHVITTRVNQAQGVIDETEANARLAPSELDKIRETPVTGAGCVNIKKIVGNSTSDWEDIYSYARNDADLLKRQLELMDPQVIFCCGCDETNNKSVFECLQIILPGLKISKTWNNGIAITGNGLLLIDWWHPSARGNYLQWDKLDTEDRFRNPCVLTEIGKLNWSKKA